MEPFYVPEEVYWTLVGAAYAIALALKFALFDLDFGGIAEAFRRRRRPASASYRGRGR